ncbi:hypothetical protein WJX75_008823 [Coccomyxa subellipsoidea]|uniref:Uncharacterized protein n=1 Tax=Coccomyxa subellipsoidea TaxID=248742 RepID=A0ABR2YLH6_9CHLO
MPRKAQQFDTQPGETMGKSRKRSRHCNTGYPYNPIRVAHIHVVRPKVRHSTDSSLFIGLFVETVHPVFGSVSMEGRRNRRSLKRLDFVRAYSEYYWSKANNIVAAVYTNSRALVPSALNSSIRAVEDKVTEFGTPLLAAVQSRSEQVLTSLDRKVDSALSAAQSVLYPKGLDNVVAASRAQHAATVEAAHEARDAYLKKVEEALEFLRAAGISGAAKYAAGTVYGCVDEAQKIPPALEREAEAVLLKVSEAWTKLVSLPPVNKLLDTAQPSVEFTRRKYVEAHGAIVASAAYTRTLETAAQVLHKVTESVVYRFSASKLYPVISCYADPALDRITHSPYYSAVVDHLKPTCANSQLAKSGSMDTLPCIQC